MMCLSEADDSDLSADTVHWHGSMMWFHMFGTSKVKATSTFLDANRRSRVRDESSEPNVITAGIYAGH